MKYYRDLPLTIQAKNWSAINLLSVDSAVLSIIYHKLIPYAGKSSKQFSILLKLDNLLSEKKLKHSLIRYTEFYDKLSRDDLTELKALNITDASVLSSLYEVEQLYRLFYEKDQAQRQNHNNIVEIRNQQIEDFGFSENAKENGLAILMRWWFSMAEPFSMSCDMLENWLINNAGQMKSEEEQLLRLICYNFIQDARVALGNVNPILHYRLFWNYLIDLDAVEFYQKVRFSSPLGRNFSDMWRGSGANLPVQTVRDCFFNWGANSSQVEIVAQSTLTIKTTAQHRGQLFIETPRLFSHKGRSLLCVKSSDSKSVAFSKTALKTITIATAPATVVPTLLGIVIHGIIRAFSRQPRNGYLQSQLESRFADIISKQGSINLKVRRLLLPITIDYVLKRSRFYHSNSSARLLDVLLDVQQTDADKLTFILNYLRAETENERNIRKNNGKKLDVIIFNNLKNFIKEVLGLESLKVDNDILVLPLPNPPGNIAEDIEQMGLDL